MVLGRERERERGREREGERERERGLKTEHTQGGRKQDKNAKKILLTL